MRSKISTSRPAFPAWPPCSFWTSSSVRRVAARSTAVCASTHPIPRKLPLPPKRRRSRTCSRPRPTRMPRDPRRFDKQTTAGAALPRRQEPPRIRCDLRLSGAGSGKEAPMAECPALRKSRHRKLTKSTKIIQAVVCFLTEDGIYGKVRETNRKALSSVLSRPDRVRRASAGPGACVKRSSYGKLPFLPSTPPGRPDPYSACTGGFCACFSQLCGLTRLLRRARAFSRAGFFV